MTEQTAPHIPADALFKSRERAHDIISELAKNRVISAGTAVGVVYGGLELFGGDLSLLDPSNTSTYASAVGIVAATYALSMRMYAKSDAVKLVKKARDDGPAQLLAANYSKRRLRKLNNRLDQTLLRRPFYKQVMGSALWHGTRATLMSWGATFGLFQHRDRLSQREVNIAHLLALLGADPSDHGEHIRASDAFSHPAIQAVMKNSAPLLELLAENTPSIRQFTGRLLANMGDETTHILGVKPFLTKDTFNTFHDMSLKCFSKAITAMHEHNIRQHSVHLINDTFGRTSWTTQALQETLDKLQAFDALPKHDDLFNTDTADACKHMAHLKQAVEQALSQGQLGPIKCHFAGLKRYDGFVADKRAPGRPESLETIWSKLYPEHPFTVDYRSEVIKQFGKEMQKRVEAHDDFINRPPKERREAAQDKVNAVLARTATDMAMRR
jgi:hypothetical protein